MAMPAMPSRPIVLPSGRLRATSAAPSVPEAPGLLMTITFCPSLADRVGCIARATTSVELPASNGTIIWTGDWARTASPPASSDATDSRKGRSRRKPRGVMDLRTADPTGIRQPRVNGQPGLPVIYIGLGPI